MNVLKLLLFGIIQAAAGFLPVSSFGHLLLANRLLSYETEDFLFTAVMLHLGTLLVIVLHMRREIRLVLRDFAGVVRDLSFNLGAAFANGFLHRGVNYRRVVTGGIRRMTLNLTLASLAAFLTGSFLSDAAHFTAGRLIYPAMCFLVSGIVLTVADLVGARIRVRPVRLAYAPVVGLITGFGVLPGISRNAMAAGFSMLGGMNQKQAVRYSFLLSVPLIAGSLVSELARTAAALGGAAAGKMLAASLPGTAAAFAAGLILFRPMRKLFSQAKLRMFGSYSLAIGVIAMIIHFLPGEG